MPTHRLIGNTVLILAVGLFAVAGCGRSNDSNTVPGQASLPPAEVRLGYFANVTHAQAVLGVSSGEIAKAVQPSKLTTRVFNAGPSLIEALFAGEIEIGYVGPGPALSAQVKSRGEGIRIIAGAAANGVLIVARKGSGIVRLEDLKGRRLATPQQGNTQDIAARHYLISILKQPDASNVVPVPNAEQVSLMTRGEIDAAWAPEPWGSRLIAEAGAALVAKEEEIWPERKFNLTLVVTTPDFLVKHPDIVRRVLTVHGSWTKRLTADPQKYAGQLNDALGTLTGKKLADGVVASALKNVEFTDEPLEGTLKTMGEWAFDLNFLDRRPVLTGLTDLRLLKDTQRP